MLYQHFAHEPIGVWEEMREDSRGLYVKGRLVTGIERGRDVLALLNEGALNGLSIGFRTRRARRDPSTGVRMLYQHFAHEPIGVWEEMREDKRGLYVKGRIVTGIERGREVLALLNEGALNGLSIGFRTRRARRDAATGLRTLLDIELWEVSVVTFPLLQGSQITAIGTKKDALAQSFRAASASLRNTL
jgi:HK97 family phage prohead protease